MQLRASAVPPNLNRILEAKIESQKYELQSSERSTDNTGFTEQWDEVNLTSIQGVYVDDRVATSTSSVIRIPVPAISHLPPAGSDPEPFLQKREYNAESSFKIGCSSKYTTSENFENSSGSTQFSIPTTSFTTGKYRSYSDSPWLWRTQRESGEAEANMIQKRILSFFAISQSRYATAWWSSGAKSIDELITSASTTGRPTPDFENLDFKIATGLRKIFAGDLEKQVAAAAGKAQSEKRTVSGREIASMIHVFFRRSGGNEAISDLKHLPKVKLENDHVQDFDTKWDEVWSAVTDRPTDSILESRYQIRVDESEGLKYLLQVYAQETTVGDKKCDYCKIEVDGPKTSRAENQGFSCESEKPRRGQTCNGNSDQGKSKRKRQIKCKKTTPREETASVGSRRGQGSWGEACAFKHDPNKKGKGKGRLGSPHRNSEGGWKGSDDGSAEGAPTFTGKKSVREKRTANFVQTSWKEVAQRWNSCIFWHVPEWTQFKAPGECRFGSLPTNTQQNLLLKRIQHRLVFTFHQMMNNRCKNGKISRMTRPNTEWDFIISRTNTYTKKIGTYIWSHPVWISKSAKSKRSNILREICSMDLEHEKKKQGKQLGFYTRTCTRFQVHILTIKIGSSNQVQRGMFLHFL